MKNKTAVFEYEAGYTPEDKTIKKLNLKKPKEKHKQAIAGLLVLILMMVMFFSVIGYINMTSTDSNSPNNTPYYNPHDYLPGDPTPGGVRIGNATIYPWSG